jgi:cytochrome c biogenesis factor
MLANFGFFALLTAFAAALYATVMALLGAYRRRPTWLASAHHAALLTWPWCRWPA